MQIVYDYQVFNWQKYGGISRYFCELGSRIDRLPESHVTFLAGLHINDYLQRNHADLTIGRLRPAGKVWNRACFLPNRLWGLGKMSQQQPDILHYTYYDCYPATAPKIKVLTVYDMIDERFPEPLFLQEVGAVQRQKWQVLHDRLLQKKQAAVAAMDHIIVPSLNTKKDLLEFCKIDPQKITVIYHGCGLTPPAAAPITAHPKPFIFFVGKRDWYKNFARLLMAYGSRPALTRDFDLVCFGSNPFTPEELEAIAQLGLIDRVLWKNGSDAELVAHYEQAAVFAFPSLYEGFGYPPMEAMTIGCPVACSNVSCFPETVADAAELFDPYDVDSIAQSLEAVLYSPTYRTELINRGRERAQRFSWQQCAEEQAALYRSLIGSSV
jgi:glycosyltransferase involved in cell wall biosynthesis